MAHGTLPIRQSVRARIDFAASIVQIGKDIVTQVDWNRRQLLASAGVAGIAAASGASLAATRKVERAAGVQLYTLRDSMAEDVETTLQAVAGIGFGEVEFAGYFDRTAKDLRELLTRYELESPSTHVPGSVVREDPNAFVATAAEAGHRYVTIAWMEESLRQSAADWQRWAEDANRLGELCREHGMRAAYHNHDFEFLPIDGIVPFDLLLAETDAELVDFELDFFWVRKAGLDIREVLASAPERFTMAHIKDIDADGNMVDAGAGTINFAAILNDPLAAHIRHPFVEHDRPADPFRTVAIGHQVLKAALGAGT